LLLNLGSNLGFLFITNLHPGFALNQLNYLLPSQRFAWLGESPKLNQFLAPDIDPILLGVPIFINPAASAICDDYGVVQILAQALLENSAAKVLTLAQHPLLNCRA
jgi:hypothetical protein